MSVPKGQDDSLEVPSGIREGDWDPEPQPCQPSRQHPIQSAEVNSSATREGDFDPEPPSCANAGRIATEKDDRPFYSPTLKEVENTRRALDDDEDEDTAEEPSWLQELGWLLVWGVLVWFGWQVWSAIRLTLSLPTPFRAAALVAEAVVATVAIAWIVRLVRLFSLGNARQWEKPEGEADREKTRIDLLHYYQDLAHGARREAFSRQFPKSDRPNALRELDDLCQCPENMTKDWWKRQRKLDELIETRARAIARKHAALVALKTATSPWKIVDVLAVFYNSARMVERIAKLYGQTCSGPQALRLALRWSFNLYVAGQLGDIAEKGAETAAETAVSEIEKTASNAGTWLSSALPFAGRMFAKVGEGAANYYLCWRLGRQAIEAFRPIPDKMPRAVKNRAKWTSFRILALLAALATAFAVAAFIAAGIRSFLHNADTDKPAVVQAEEQPKCQKSHRAGDRH